MRILKNWVGRYGAKKVCVVGQVWKRRQHDKSPIHQATFDLQLTEPLATYNNYLCDFIK